MTSITPVSTDKAVDSVVNNSGESAEMLAQQITHLTATVKVLSDALNDHRSQQSANLSQLNGELTSIREGQGFQLRPVQMTENTLHQMSTAKATWRDILSYNLAHEVALLSEFVATKERSLSKLFALDQPWNSWSYRLSYPRVSSFLDRAQQVSDTKQLQIASSDRDEDDNVRYFESKSVEVNYEAIWQRLATRVAQDQVDARAKGDFATWTSRPKFVKMRVLKITDLTPTLAAMCIAVSIGCCSFFRTMC